MGRGRPKLKLVVSAEQREALRAALKESTAPQQRDRLQAIQLACTGRHTHEEIAGLLGRARSTVQLWLNEYEAGGLPGLLARKLALGKVSALQRPEVQAELQAGLKKGRWRTAGQIAAWLAQAHGIQCAAGFVLLAGKSRRDVEGAKSGAHRAKPGRPGRV